MTCVRCQRDISENAVYCEACGAPQRGTAALPWSARRLTRAKADAKIAGVCAGFADHFGVDVTLVRALWVIFSVVPGAVVGGVIAYLLAWIVMPEGPATRVAPPQGRRLMRSATDRKVAGVCGGIAEYLGVDATPVRLLWIVVSVLPGAILGGLVVYLAAWAIMSRPPAPALASGPSPADAAG
jgi:phage shock protein PspC (stress-responsive transcriptional regulator)